MSFEVHTAAQPDRGVDVHEVFHRSALRALRIGVRTGRGDRADVFVSGRSGAAAVRRRPRHDVALLRNTGSERDRPGDGRPGGSRADQDWSSAARFSAPFPTWGLPGGSGTATGSYVYDPITGIGTATLSSYGGSGSHDYPAELFQSFTIGLSQWEYRLNNPVTGRIARYSAGTPQSAASFVGPATTPPVAVPLSSRGWILVLALTLMAVVVAVAAPRHGARRAVADASDGGSERSPGRRHDPGLTRATA